MKKKISSRILVVFILNVIFTMFELLGGFLSRSSAIMTHAVVDLVETFALGISYLCEKIGVKKANKTFTFGYSRFIILGAFVTTLFLIYGCTFMLYIGVTKIFDPHEVGHLEMIIVAIFGIIVNIISTYTTRSKADINEEAVYVHTYNYIISWVLVLIGSIIIAYTKMYQIDAILTILINLLIIYRVSKHLKKIVTIFLDRSPDKIDITLIRSVIKRTPNVRFAHDIHVWSLNEFSNYLTAHVVVDDKVKSLKQLESMKTEIKEDLEEVGIDHATIEFESMKKQ